ncbi:hypothetical protein AV649_19970 [Rossellomorea marisflavi]|uniref:Uncharacterized protein n=1 Tax=Rossellomorea marisflavi TaxID=189381 RepID=A0A161RMN0_9BACI|nr:hypothetical protein VL12_21225 [Rossellomorea marisflavi]KZE48269.1 hypothetical protein AV649_19970 [Rossellomorea marisflavi]
MAYLNEKLKSFYLKNLELPQIMFMHSVIHMPVYCLQQVLLLKMYKSVLVIQTFKPRWIFTLM